MIIRDIVKLADMMLGLGIDCRVYEKNEMDEELKDMLSGDKRLEQMVECVNLTLCEMAEDYLPLTAKEILQVKGTVPYTAFKYSIIQILSAKTEGINVRYYYRPEGVEFDYTGKAEIVYTYRPNRVGFLDKAEIGSSQAGARLVAYGACAEYCLLNSSYEEAQIWDRRYKDTLLSCVTKKSEVTLKRRSWL